MKCDYLCFFFNQSFCKLTPRAKIPFGSECVNEKLRIEKMCEMIGKLTPITPVNTNKCQHTETISVKGIVKCEKCGIVMEKI